MRISDWSSDVCSSDLTQSLGGGFGKKDIWLDRAYVAIHPVNWGSITLGRMENPFRTTDLLFDEDLNFDGVAANVNSGDMLGDTVRLWATGGAFPFEYTSGSFPDKDVAKIDRKSTRLNSSH